MAGYERLAHVFVELADTLVEEFDPVDFLQVLVDRCVELLDADAAGLVLADQRGDLQLVAATEERARLLELFQLDVREGPCLDCFSSGVAQANIDLAAVSDRWPRFRPAAVAAGFGGAHALPMRLRRQVIGALNLFTDAPRRLSADDVAVGQAMADVATIGLLHERNLHDQTVLSEQLQTALNSRVLIEQAKGVLAARAGLSVAEAFVRMRAHARRHGLALTAVAEAVVAGRLDARALLGS
ncbi:GAF and ANTAR domain-containing protein [Geodermatophilus sp. SYSU D00691]